MDKELKLSVIIISYKQSKYIKQAIESVLMQKINFKYELLLADDCSNDGTLEIMKEYEKKYPDIVKVLCREKNLGCAKNSLDACSRARGEYITILEGDDYWCDENKIQFQVDFLDKHKDYIAVGHLQEGRDLNNNFKGIFPKRLKNDLIVNNPNDFVKKNKIFSCSTLLHVNFYKDFNKLEDYKKIRTFDNLIGDAQLNFYLCTLGKVYIVNKPMMIYRMRNNDGDSNFNSSHSINEIQYRYMNIYIELEKFYNYKYTLYPRIKNSYTLGVTYDLLKFNFKNIKKFNKLCPKKYKLKIIICYPFTCIKILLKRFIKK